MYICMCVHMWIYKFMCVCVSVCTYVDTYIQYIYTLDCALTAIILQVTKRLVGIGRFEQAAEYLEGIDAHKDAIDIYIRAGNVLVCTCVCRYMCLYGKI
jgi:hypothetical protein